MDKHILDQYIDACALIEETEKDIQKLQQKKRTVIQTNVSGSNPEHPYNPQHFKIQGTTFTFREDSQLRMEEKLLEKRSAGGRERREDSGSGKEGGSEGCGTSAENHRERKAGENRRTSCRKAGQKCREREKRQRVAEDPDPAFSVYSQHVSRTDDPCHWRHDDQQL